jgi:heterodisulfide reductase subunit E
MVSTKRILVRLLYKLSYVRTSPNFSALSVYSLPNDRKKPKVFLYCIYQIFVKEEKMSDAIFWMLLAVTIVSILVFLSGMWLNMKKWGLGSTGYGEPAGGGSALGFLSTLKREILSEGHPPFLKTFVLDVILQRRIARRSKIRWMMHMMIFLGWFMFEVNDIFGYLLLGGIIIAILRRLCIKDVREGTTGYDIFLIGGLFIITITGFITEWILEGILPAYSEYALPETLFHVVIALLFGVAVIPFTKYIHLFTTPLTLLARGGGK